MGKSRGRALPKQPEALWSELDASERDAVGRFAEVLGIPAGAWPHLDETLALVVSVACARRIGRLTRIQGVSLATALEQTAIAFGLSLASVKAAHHRRPERSLRARRE